MAYKCAAIPSAATCACSEPVHALFSDPLTPSFGQTSPSTWRPLLHATAVSGDIETTERVYEEMKEHTGKEVFDSFKSRISHAFNYVMLAYGHGEGYEVRDER